MIYEVIYTFEVDVEDRDDAVVEAENAIGQHDSVIDMMVQYISEEEHHNVDIIFTVEADNSDDTKRFVEDAIGAYSGRDEIVGHWCSGEPISV